MKEDDLQHFVCPVCHGTLRLVDVFQKQHEQVKDAILICRTERHRFQISDFIPRFVSPDEATAAFGFEWNKHPNTQFDSINGMTLTEERFYRQTNWSHNLSGQRILEVGSGAGRFTEIALQTGAQ